MMSLLKKLLYRLTHGLAGYLIFFILLAAWYHADVLWNVYNYGRHWDWTFFSVSDLYHQFIYRFFYSYKQNSLGYFDIISVSLVDVCIKSAIYGIFKIANGLSIVTLTIPILNKIMVFLVFPTLTSLGIWMACRKILSNIYERNRTLFMLIAIFSNLVYTFSFLIILDLHGGALNREVSSIFFPWFFCLLFDYWECTRTKYFEYRIILLSLMFAVSDISNMFFFAVLIFLNIAIKDIPLKKKLTHIATLIIAAAMFNAYWLHAFVIGDAINTEAILSERSFDYNILKAYSASFTDNLFLLNSAHNLILRLFTFNPLIYIPFLFLYLGILRSLMKVRITHKRIRLYLMLFLGYLFITILTNGVFSIGKIYVWLYTFNVLAFIRAAIRYMPNLAAFTVFLFLVTYRERWRESSSKLSHEYVLLVVPIIASLFLLLTNSKMISLIQNRVVKDSEFNQDVGSLYQYDPSFIAATRQDKLEYNVIPVPSWFSPIFVDNIYPKTSQGSDTDGLYLPHPVITTNGVPLFSSQLIETFMDAKPDPYLYSITNTKYAWFKTTQVYYQVNPRFYFSVDWISGTDPSRADVIKKISKKHGMYEIPEQYFVPVMYIPDKTLYSDITLRHLPNMLSASESATTAVYLANQNQNKQINAVQKETSQTAGTVLEFKKINPTKYRLVLHHAPDELPVVLSNAFYANWKLYAVPHVKDTINPAVLHNYVIIPGNEKSQVDKDALAQYIRSGWITTLGDMKEKKDSEVEFSRGQENHSESRPYKIDFVSKSIKGTVQNNNLRDGTLTETWSPSAVELSEDRHLKSNGFSNSWIVPVKELCANSISCIRRSNGSYDIELVAEFKPQRYYTIGLIISITSIVLALLTVVIAKINHET